MARLATAMAASLTASGSVGCAWQVRAMSSAEAPNSMASAASAIMLPASAQISCTPSTRSVLASARIFTKPAKVNMTSEGFVKILADAKTDRVLGVQLICADAGNMIAEAALAIEFGASAEDIARTCHAHPTLPEAVKEAAMAVAKRAIHM